MRNKRRLCQENPGTRHTFLNSPVQTCGKRRMPRSFPPGLSLCYTGHMQTESLTYGDATPLRLLPAYLGTSAIEEVIQTVRGRRMLWLEILVNDQLDLTPWQSEPAVQLAYQTACRWYTQYRRLLTALIERAPLPVDTGPIDFLDYRVFAEALSFVYAHR